ncbi:MAG: hypothetical protein EON61_02725 [Alphaproteobacteria bacterium]|jgi:hypothetical protein|nr:MAG: hypothetical protein EON61_02725 [Alphaproteobacteria bacterium]
MVLVEILLPLAPDRLGDTTLQDVSRHLTNRFGGVTTFVRTPGEGAWKTQEGVVKDQIVVLEVMAPTVDHAWWRVFRTDLEHRLEQQEIVIRCHPIERL